MSAMGDFAISVGQLVADELRIPAEWGDQLLTRYAGRVDVVVATAFAENPELPVKDLEKIAADAVVEEFRAEAGRKYGVLPRVA